jgi:glycine/D-amino acid oxidase-like deaminating enzyme
MNDPDILIVGAGIFGLAAALELQRRGHQVTVLDAGPVPHPLASSTDISKVVRLEYGADESYTALMEQAREGWLRWNEEWEESLYHEDGVTMLTRGPMPPGEFTYESYHLLKEREHPLERLDQDDIARRFPAWNASVYSDGYFNPRSGYAESGRVVAALAQWARQEGVTLQTGHRVQSLAEEGGRVTGVVSDDGQRFGAGQVVVAAGAWTPWLLPELKGAMRSVGQPIFHLQPPDPALFKPPRFYTFSADVSRTGWYGFSLHPQEGVVKIAHHGPGREIDPLVDERRVSEEQIEMLRYFLKEAFPVLQDAPLVHTRLCLYCDVRDGHLWIDRHPQRQGLVVAGGGSGHGFKFGPVLGRLIADAVEGKSNPYLQRFRWRKFDDDTVIEEATRYQGERTET